MSFKELSYGFSLNKWFCQCINYVDLSTLNKMSNLFLVKPQLFTFLV